MFTSPSCNSAELGDIDVNAHAGLIHLHYLSLPSHDVVGHAVSEDGLTFKPAIAAIRTGDPGACDDDQIWTMHTVRNPANGVFHMYYTAISLAEHGQVQRIALATSSDFIHWKKYEGNPVCVAAPPHYNADLRLLGRVAFRDPFVYIEGGIWHMLVCASAGAGDRLRRGCVAHATSQDGFHWELRKPLYAPAHFDDPEVPALLKHNDKYYLLFHEFRTPFSLYRMADSIEGPWIAPPYDDILPGQNAVTRCCDWEGRKLMYTWYRCKADWHRRDEFYASLFPPKEVNFEADGALRLSSFSGWKRYHKGPAEELSPRDLTAFVEGPAGWECLEGRIHAAVHGQIVGAASCDFGDFILDMQARCEQGRALGIIFRAGADLERGNWLRLDYERRRAELHRLAPRDTGFNRFVRMQPSLVQSFDLPLARGENLRLHLVASREYVEISVNERVCISTATYAETHGRIGVFLENAKGSFNGATVQPLRAPESGG